MKWSRREFLVGLGGLCAGCKPMAWKKEAGSHSAQEVVFAVQYASSRFPARFIFENAKGEVDFAWDVFLIRDTSGWILVDTGAGPRGEEPFPLKREAPLKELLSRAGCNTVRAIVLTHGHWDHAGGCSDFPGIPIYMSQTEWETMHRVLDSSKESWCDGYRRSDLVNLDQSKARGELQLFRNRTIVGSHLQLVEVGGHTEGALALIFQPEQGPGLVLASDNAYFFENLDLGHEIPPCSRRGKNALPLIRSLAPGAPILPGHDPKLMGYPPVKPNIARLYP